MNHLENCRCWDCTKEAVKFIYPNGTVGYHEMVVIRTDFGNSYLGQKAYEGPALMLG